MLPCQPYREIIHGNHAFKRLLRGQRTALLGHLFL